MNKALTLLLISFALLSCDPIHQVDIKNESKSDIILQISFNRAAIEEGSTAHFMNYYPGFERITALSIDTVNLISTFKIAPGNTFPIHSKIARDPDFNLFKEMLILKPDTLFYKNADEIADAFKQKKSRYWELMIK